MREARLSRPRAGPAADDRGHRRAVVRRAEGRPRDQRPLGRQEPGHRVDARHLERLARLQRRQDRRAGGGRASSSRFPVGRPAAGCGRPAAASSSARRARSWPRTSVRSGGSGSTRSSGGSTGGGRSSPRRYATASARCRTGIGLDAAELRLGRRLGCAEDPIEPGQPARPRRPRRHRAPAGRARRARARRPTACSASRSGGTWREAASSASPIERSKPEPSFRRPAGARLTVIRRSGHSSWAEVMPLRTRCFASEQARSARPTMAKHGTPLCEVRLDLDTSRLEPDQSVGDGSARARFHARRGRATRVQRVCV